MLQVTFPEIARVLEGSHSSVSAAEGHGCLCGALSTTSDYSMERWLEEILAGEDSEEVRGSDARDLQALQLLFTDTLEALRGDEMSFEPLLPEDDASLEQRAAALSQWCQGFLYGFGTGRPVKDEEIPANVDEVLRDLTHIGRATVDLGDTREEDEEAYAQVVEYVRAGVQLIHDELLDLRDSHAHRSGITDADDGEGEPSDIAH